jgi:glycosyltransferase involved in cell wall biosynthesis
MPEAPELPPIAAQPLSLILLGHNAEAHVTPLVLAWRETLLSRQLPFEILLVDDGSNDGTAARAQELAATVPELQLLRHEQPRGIGAALGTGLAASMHPLLAVAPCHPAYTPQDLARFLAEIDKVHFLTGYRAGLPVPLLARLLGNVMRVLGVVLFSHAGEKLPGWLGWKAHVGAVLARLVYGVRLRDVHSPFRVFRREVLARSPLQSDGDFALVEQLAKVNFAGYYFGLEVPLSVTPPERPFPQQPRGRSFREALRVFSKPSFGPATVQ